MSRTGILFAFALVLSCGGPGPPKKVQGGEGEVCYPGEMCNMLLICVDDRCVKPPDNSTPNNVSPNVDPNNISPNNIDPATCGDGRLDAGELCDGSDLNGQTCAGLGFDGGQLRCNPQCTYDTSSCDSSNPAICGNGVIEAGEVCDGANLQGASCETEGFAGGTLRCGFDCRSFDTEQCSRGACGNGILEADEVCDGEELSGQTCQSRGFDGGTLRCNSACAAFDTTLCTRCGNGVAEAGEACDGADLNGHTCASRGFASGVLRCDSSCMYDTSMCVANLACVLTAPAELPPCDVNDLASCACEGCTNDGVCIDTLAGLADDCVCPDCRTDPTCSSVANCNNDGQCDPYYEGCVCADCMGHPQCQNNP